MLFHVYDDPKPDGYYLNEPFGFYRTMLDADWLLYVLLPFLLVIVVAGLMLAWHLHEIPKHKAEKKKMRQAELVSALTVLGLFEHWVWAVALFIAYMDWQAVEDWLLGMLRRARTEVLETSEAEPLPVATAAAPAMVEAREPTIDRLLPPEEERPA